VTSGSGFEGRRNIRSGFVRDGGTETGCSDEAGGAGGREGGTAYAGNSMGDPSCLDAPTLGSARSALNCTEVSCDIETDDAAIPRFTGWPDHAGLPRLFRIGPIGIVESDAAGFQKGKIVSVANLKPETEQ
jgi:hypothetical protein